MERSDQPDNRAANDDGLGFDDFFCFRQPSYPAQLSEDGTSADSFDPEPAFGSVIDKDLFNDDFCDFACVGLHGDTDFSLLFENTSWTAPVSSAGR